eukprot:scaffold989_cov53-Isochrysis_galbana.AAC.2
MGKGAAEDAGGRVGVESLREMGCPRDPTTATPSINPPHLYTERGIQELVELRREELVGKVRVLSQHVRS